MVHEAFGVFVSPTGSDTSGDGSRVNPYKSLDKAIDVAGPDGKKVFACADGGSFTEAVTIGAAADGISVHGGFRCSGWTLDPALRTKLEGPANKALRIQGLSLGVTIEDFDVESASAGTPGTPSIGVFVSGSENVVLRRMRVVAGDGADGSDGFGNTSPAANGKSGNTGSAACQNGGDGGAAVGSTPCTESVGAKGGSGGLEDIGAPTAAKGQPTTLSGGQGGTGETTLNSATWSCSVGAGKTGQHGKHGDDGAGGVGPGALNSGGWIPPNGEAGVKGGVGQGGGGGGGALAPASCPGSALRSGAAGGSGGSGGCGGGGGDGGQAGGASIALASFQSSVTLEAVDLVAGRGGDGGNGGSGQPGGNGASGGGGGSGASGAFPSKSACAGGKGGDGGDGGNGGGGAGGPSIAIAFDGDAPTRSGGSVQAAPSAAQGGLGGDGSSTGLGAGEDGVIAQELAL